MKRPTRRDRRLRRPIAALAAATVLVLQLFVFDEPPVLAAPGGLVADVVINESYDVSSIEPGV